MAVFPTLVAGELYKIINVSTATVVTYSPQNGKIQGYMDKNLDSQMWFAASSEGISWTLKSFRKDGEKDVYLSYVGNEPTRELPLVGSPQPRNWNITQTNTRGGAEYRIWFPNGPEPGVLADLAHASSADGTTIQLFENRGNGNQYWLFQKIPVPN